MSAARGSAERRPSASASSITQLALPCSPMHAEFARFGRIYKVRGGWHPVGGTVSVSSQTSGPCLMPIPVLACMRAGLDRQEAAGLCVSVACHGSAARGYLCLHGLPANVLTLLLLAVSSTMRTSAMRRTL